MERVSAARLLDVDPDLAGLLTADRADRARAGLTVSVRRRSVGPWSPGRRSGAASLWLGLLILDGVLASDVVLEDTVSTEILGAGDLVRPWATTSSDLVPRNGARLTVLAECRFAVLDQRCAVQLSGYPEIYAVLMERAAERARRLATMQAIAHVNSVERRLLALFSLLAERWGRVTYDGLLVPMTLSHRVLGQLVGARRPTVSTALGKLARDGRLHRRRDGAWVLRR